MRRLLKRVGLGLLAALAVLSLVAVVTPQGRASAKTAGFVLQVVPGFPIQPLGWFTQEPVRTAVEYSAGTRSVEADIYRIPDRKQRAAVVLFLGVNPAGRDDDRVVNLASALARAGFVVLVPWSENMMSKRVSPADVEMLVAAFQYLRSLDRVDPERIGGAGFCVGSSLLVVAASDPRISADVSFINFFSGFYDGRDYIKQFAARRTFYDGTEEPWEPDPLTAEVLSLLMIESLSLPSERDALEGHFSGGRTLTAAEVRDLSREAQAVHGLLSGTTLEEADALLREVPQRLLDAVDALSPSKHLDGVSARLLIMHDREDSLAPVEESRRLADAVADRGDTVYTEFSFFSHVDPGVGVGPIGLLRESLKLYRHLYAVVRIAG
ncbi:MAG: dienelactone hydrolase family protein [Chloroflexi bacterium]|nr:dienelactone hydrolase family protein [Chloroflexota bacterium]